MIGQKDTAAWKRDFERWAQQDTERLQDHLSRATIWFPMYNIHTPSLKFSYRVEIVRASKVVHAIINRHCRIITDSVKQACQMLHETLARGTSERRHVQRYIDIMDHFNVTVLHQTFTRFIEHAKCTPSQRLRMNDRTNYEKATYLSSDSSPFFTTTELRCMAHNLGLPVTTDSDALYKQIRACYVHNDLILAHVRYISEKNYVGLVDYYTFQGDQVFNQYLRTTGQPDNNIVRRWIRRMMDVLHRAPRGKNPDIVLWRFLKSDQHITSNTKDHIYETNSFMSCTRDPSSMGKFGGTVLLRIRVPQPSLVPLLCIETFSRFPIEHEVLLPPGSRFRVLGRNNFVYRHVQDGKELHRTYDLELIPNLKHFVYPVKQPVTDSMIPLVELDKIDLSARHQRDHRIDHFNRTYADVNHYFAVELDYIRFVFYWQRYPATVGSAGKDMVRKYWFAKGGYSWVLMDQTDATVLLLLEFGHEELHVNFQLTQHSLTDQIPISEATQIRFLTQIGKAFGLNRVVIHSRYRSCKGFQKINPEREHEYWFSRYNHDMYRYLLDQHRRFNFAPNVMIRTFETDFLRQLDVPKSLHQRTCYQKLKISGRRVTLRDLLLLVFKTLCHHVDFYEREIRRHIQSVLKLKRAVLDIRYYLEIE